MSNLAHEDDASRAEEEARRHRAALEERLRRLNWPEAPPGVRERSLEELKRKLAEMNGAFGEEDGEGEEAAAEDEAPRRDAR